MKHYIDKLQKASDSQTVKQVLDEALTKWKIVPSVLPEELRETEDSFDELSLDEQKRVVLELLDKNKLYVNLSDLDDESFEISEADKAFTKSFYGLDEGV